MVVQFELLALLEAKADKESELAALLREGRAIAAAEPGTVTWYGFKINDTRYGIFDTFETSDARLAHLDGAIPPALSRVRREPVSRRFQYQPCRRDRAHIGSNRVLSTG